MLGIVMTGHGCFASGLLQGVEQGVGPQMQCQAEGISTVELAQALNAACRACDSGEGVVILSVCWGARRFARRLCWLRVMVMKC